MQTSQRIAPIISFILLISVCDCSWFSVSCYSTLRLKCVDHITWAPTCRGGFSLLKKVICCKTNLRLCWSRWTEIWWWDDIDRRYSRNNKLKNKNKYFVFILDGNGNIDIQRALWCDYLTNSVCYVTQLMSEV